MDGLTWQWLVLSMIAHIPSAPFRCIRRHFLVKWLGFIVAMRNKRKGYAKPFSFDPYSKCLAVVAFVSVRKIAKRLQRHLHGVVPFGVQPFPYGQCCIAYSAGLYRMVGIEQMDVLQVLCHTIM